MTNKDYIDNIQQINEIINRTRTENKDLIYSLERLKRFYVWEQKDYNREINGETKKSTKRINIWKTNKVIQKDVCFECQSKLNIQYHHVVPDSLGGSKTIPLCNICHGKVHNRKFVDISFLVKEGLRKKKEQGIILGRRKGTKKTDEDVLGNLKYKDVIEYLKSDKYSLRAISQMTNIAVNSVHKVSKILKKNNL
jgi:5-methylcytosine-specific restriction endonuclease McrA